MVNLRWINIVVVFLVGGVHAEPMRPGGLSGDGCKAKGGRIESIGPLIECNEDEYFYGRVLGMKCSCICCGPDELKEVKEGAPPKSPLTGIPKPNQDVYLKVRDAKNWRNPFLVLRDDGVEILGVGVFPLDKVEVALLNLPKKAWPYGRVVALQWSGVVASGTEANRRAKNGKLLTILRRMSVHVEMWPSA